MKNLILASLLICMASLLTYYHFSTKNKYVPMPKEAKVPPELMMEWDAKLTRPPAEDINTQELLLQAYEQIKQDADDPEASGVLNINWNEMGPNNVRGRTRAILIDHSVSSGQKVWAGSISGGLWLSSNGGTIWQPVNDFFANLAVTAIAQHPTNSNQLYFGTGEGWFNGDAVRGLGIWHSTNGGQNWARLTNTLASTNGSSLEALSHIQKLVVDANGHLYAATRESGLMRLEDGGNNMQKQWQKITIPSACAPGILQSCNFNFVDDIEIASDGTMYAAFQDCFILSPLFSNQVTESLGLVLLISLTF